MNLRKFRKAGAGVALAAVVSVAAILLSGCCCSTPTGAADVYYPYTFPLTSPGEKFGGLPPAVQHSIRAQAGGADIYDIVKLTPSGRVIYEIVFVESWRLPPLYVESDGSVLFPDFSVAVQANHDMIGAVTGGAVGGLRLSDLPINVANTIYQKAPTAEVDSIHKLVSGEAVYYEITFKGKHTPKMLISDDGTLLEKGF